ncbi:GntR family transcriptional regulator [Xanthobacter sediminis]|uniref:GntR family transcriptional regulator n=1 Tax=Xanthobacter sediminis TaxID=3119926 RepID=UPI0037285367
MEQNLREQVLQHVRSEIISGQTGPGKMYSVPTLASDLRVSTTPVREALLELARNGLIEPVRNRGFKVVEPTVQELRDLFDMRELLEVRAAEIIAAAPKARRKLSGLTALADDIKAAVAADDVPGYLAADRRFHQAFIAAAGNELLTETAMGLRDKMRLYGISSRAGMARQAASVDEHYRLIELAQAGDVPAIKTLLTQHIRTWEPIFVDAITKRARDPFQARA